MENYSDQAKRKADTEDTAGLITVVFVAAMTLLAAIHQALISAKQKRRVEIALVTMVTLASCTGIGVQGVAEQDVTPNAGSGGVTTGLAEDIADKPLDPLSDDLGSLDSVEAGSEEPVAEVGEAEVEALASPLLEHVPTGNSAQETENLRKPPTLDQVSLNAITASGTIPAEVQPYIDMATNSFGNSEFTANHFDPDQPEYRWNPISRSEETGNYIWAHRVVDGKRYPVNQPTVFTINDAGEIIAVDKSGYIYSEIPGSSEEKGAQIVYVGDNQELPTPIKHTMKNEDGSEYFGVFYDFDFVNGESKWQFVPEINANGLAVIDGRVKRLDDQGELVRLAWTISEGERLIPLTLAENNVWLTVGIDGKITSAKDSFGKKLGAEVIAQSVVSMADQGMLEVTELNNTEFNKPVQIGRLASNDNQEIVAINEGSGWYSVWNLTVALDPGSTIEIDTETQQLVFKNAEGDLLYTKVTEGKFKGEFQMVPAPTVPETVNAYHETMDFGLEPKDPHALYHLVMTTIAEAPDHQAYWKDLGVSPDVDSVMAYLIAHNYQVPVTTPNGKHLTSIKNHKGSLAVTGEFIPAEGDIVNLADIKYMVGGVGIGADKIGNVETIKTTVLDKTRAYDLEPGSIGFSYYLDPDEQIRLVFVYTQFKTTSVGIEGLPEWEDWAYSPSDLGAIETTDPEWDGRMLSGGFKGCLQFIDEAPLVKGKRLDDDARYMLVRNRTSRSAGSVNIGAKYYPATQTLFQPKK